MRRIGIIGTGLAGLRVAAELRQAGFDGSITAWDREGCEPYDRPPLTKSLFGQYVAPLARQGLGDLGELGVETIPRAVAAVEPGETGELGEPGEAGTWQVVLEAGRGPEGGSADGTAEGPEKGAADGTVGGRAPEHREHADPGHRVHVDAVVIATGCPPRASIAGAHVLYSLADARRLSAAIGAGTRVDIVGGGWIGTELASACAARGARVELWEASPHLLGRSLGEAANEIWLPWLRAAGVTVHLGRRHPGRADAAVDPATVLVDATGAAPALPRVRADVTARGALATDAHTQVLLAGVPLAGLYAVGDCADRVEGPALEGGHWTKALGDGAVTAASILGAAPPRFAAPPEVFSTQFGHEIGLVGVVPAAAATRESTRDGFVLAWRDGGELLALLAVDSPRELSRARKALRRAAPA